MKTVLSLLFPENLSSKCLAFKQIFAQLHIVSLCSGTCIQMEGEGNWRGKRKVAIKNVDLQWLATPLSTTKK